jgi:hypothetical protein
MGQYQETLMTFSFFKQHIARRAAVALGLATVACFAHAQPNVSVTVGGVIQPGVYGRVVIGNAPPPVVIYPQPVIVTQPAVVVRQAPIYLHVPPGHSKKWAKHCYKYNACNQPVYFVQNNYRGHDSHHGHGHRGGKHSDRHGGRHDD